MAKTVIVLGGSLGGLAVTHRLLKHTRQQEKDLKVILVSKNSHFYWNLASVRAVVPGLVKDEELLQPIEPGLAQYPAGSVEFITLVSLSGGGDDLLTDFYLPTTGLLPNTGFVPKDLLTPKGYADVDDCMRVRSVLDVWAVGDVVSKPRAGFLFTESQAAGVVKNIGLALQGKEQRPVSGPPVDVFICAVGRGRGVGRLGPVPVPSFFVWAAKGRTLGMERTPKYASGSMF
ncbi:hypothetical protein HIM_00554 [Hirsutella minnesotensis 3608]|nr:hypothetical protein HIM_00554 [Hirsutella minnesotensis 3608]